MLKHLKQKLIKNANIGQSDEIFSEFTAMSIGYLPWDGKLGKENYIVSEASSYFRWLFNRTRNLMNLFHPSCPTHFEVPRIFIVTIFWHKLVVEVSDGAEETVMSLWKFAHGCSIGWLVEPNNTMGTCEQPSMSWYPLGLYHRWTDWERWDLARWSFIDFGCSAMIGSQRWGVLP